MNKINHTLSSLIVIVLAGVIGFALWATHRIEALQLADLGSSLQTVLRTTHAGIRVWATELEGDARAFAESHYNRDRIERIVATGDPKAREELRRELQPQLDVHGYLGYAILGVDGKQVEPKPGAHTDPLKLMSLKPVEIREAHRGGFAVGTPFAFPGFADPVLIAATPVRGRSGLIVAAFVLFLDPDHGFSRMIHVAQLEKTGETYAIDREGRTVTPTQPHRYPEPMTKMIRSVIAGRSGVDLKGYRDYRGVEVVGAWLWDPRLGFGLATEIDREEAYRPIVAIQRLTWTLISVIVLAGIALLVIYRAEARARQVSYANAEANRARKDLMAVVSHDLKNPITTILMSQDLLLRPPAVDELPERARRLLETMRRSALQMQRLVEDLHESARAEAGKLVLSPRNLPVDALVSRVLAAFEPLAAPRGISCRADMPQGLPDLWADPDRLFQVFSNLVGNALKFTPKGGTIEIGARAREGAVRFTVSDSGPGLPAAAIPRIFERYWQPEGGSSPGMGLGLSIAKEIVEGHGGSIGASSPPGRGATFFFTIPTARSIPIADAG